MLMTFCKISEKLFIFDFIGCQWKVTYNKFNGELWFIHDSGFTYSEHIQKDMDCVEFIIRAKLLFMNKMISLN